MAMTAFYWYAHEAEALLTRLKSHVIQLRPTGLIDFWDDRDIRAGEAYGKRGDTISTSINTHRVDEHSARELLFPARCIPSP